MVKNMENEPSEKRAVEVEYTIPLTLTGEQWSIVMDWLTVRNDVSLDCLDDADIEESQWHHLELNTIRIVRATIENSVGKQTAREWDDIGEERATIWSKKRGLK